MAKDKGILAKNKILLAAEMKIESQLEPSVRADYQKVVVAGLHAGLSGGPKSILASLKDSKDPIKDCAMGAINLAVLLMKQSRNTMPMKAMVPAAATLMFLALDSAERMGVIKITNEVVAQATHYYTNHIFKVLNISPQMLHTAAGNLHKITSNPTNMEELRRRAGIVRDPRASLPTEAPTEVPEEKTDGV